MIRRVSDLNGFEVHAADEYVGRITDSYLDGSEWVLRYLVVDMSDVILDRLVLVVPYAIRSIDWETGVCRIAPSRTEVENSPGLEVDQPVSRQYEIALHRHYEWPEYWGQAAFMDTHDVKHMPQPGSPGEADEVSHREVEADEEGDAIGPPEARQLEPDDEELQEMDFGDETFEDRYHIDLHSCAEIVGYLVQANDGASGHVRALLFEEEGYLVRFLVVDTGHHGKAKTVLVPEEWVRTVAWEEKAVHVDMERRSIVGSPAFRLGATVTSDFERKLYDYVDHL